MRRKQQLARLLGASGGLRLLDAYWGADRLTVLAYHRVMEVHPRAFAPNISATPALFDAEMAFVSQHFNVIGLPTLQAHLTHHTPLPPRPLLITFDDGYRDVYTNAFPILKKHGLPAVVFVVTSRMDNPAPLWWDVCAHTFHDTERTQANLPLVGQQSLSTTAERHTARDAFIEQAKRLPHAQKETAIASLQSTLGTPQPPTEPLFVDWGQLREMGEHGVVAQPHTVDHPILTRIPIAEAHQQLAVSGDAVQAQTGQAPIAFAYPNGGHDDYNTQIIEALQQLDYRVAFTLRPGPMRAHHLACHPFEIRRVFLSYRDTLEIFKMKVMGLPALLSRVSYHGEAC